MQSLQTHFYWQSASHCKPRDIVFVDRAEGIRWNQIIAQIQPTVTLLNAFDGALKITPFSNPN